MGNATSMFNLMRNLGGGFGIAAATTFLFRRQQFHTHRLGEHVSMLNLQTQAFFKSTQSAMMTHSGDPAAAATQTYVALWGTVQRQAAMLAFVDTFRAMAIVFLVVLPFLFIMRRPKHTRAAGPMH
jgi:DHA2 family multidrug resistance protein